MNTLDLSDKIILITGGAGAIGQVIVRRLLEHGAAVAVNDVLPKEEVKAILPQSERLRYFQADAAHAESVAAMFDAVESALGLPNVACCHAGMVAAHPVTAYPLSEYDKLMEVNVRAAFVVAQEAARRWIARSVAGHLIFTTSWVQDVPWPEITPYTMSKSAMKAMMRGFARELADKGIRANAIAPGIVGVGLAKRQWDTDPSYRARAAKAIPLGYLQTPESVADAFVFLCSDMASYMTGATLLVDGGCSLYPMD
ncbi:MAG: SDR family oxidoreductase [Chloroflexi bacterium]|jgi:NAD(P)-dependent dehydrogenase (short-subunit alcohol dehydrogenase family)|uniref:SDR family oxidoreductase n=1 Tax=Candidatus Thermofonsia Clade 3 bacterium TaxID=2364212 RepID=A0A2M8QBC0_9CHLR|nr:SDR family oxidoreductase [Candidatus Roseilinea sp. NK_OTU-006]PJF47098.1 MAG: SDR family oxidoreductase [Candidatus Thermofonsia Clade 3 bacterium]RMG64223.1 MAG: SDR family oxidoreductase [Chloroflexota bacterium]